MEQVPTSNSQVSSQVQATTQAQNNQQLSANKPSQPDAVMTPKPPKKTFLKPLIIVVMLVILAGGISAIYAFINRSRSGIQNAQKVTPQSAETIPKLGTSVSDNFEGVTLDEELWFPWVLNESGFVRINGGKAQFEIPPGNTEYTSVGLNLFPLVEGDFEVQVEAAILSGGDPAGSETALIFHNDEGDWINQIVIYLRKEEGGVYVRVAKVVNGNYEDLDFIKSYDYAGPIILKMAREGRGVTFSVKPTEAVSFETLGTLSSGFYQGRGRISLHVNSYGDNFPSVLSTFDNFKLVLQ